MILSRSEKRRNNLIYLGLFLFFIGIPASRIVAQTKSPSQKELQNKRNKLNDDIKQLNNQLSQTKASKKSQINNIVVINTKIKVREELISTINSELTKINTNIKKNTGEVNSLRLSLDKLKSEYAKMIYFAQRNQDSYTKLMFLFASGDFNQAYIRLRYFQQYTAFRKKPFFCEKTLPLSRPAAAIPQGTTPAAGPSPFRGVPEWPPPRPLD